MQSCIIFMLRSEEMALLQVLILTQLYIPLEIAPQTVAELGELGQVQFNDLNRKVNVFQRTFADEIKRLAEMDRRVLFLISQASKSNIQIPSFDPVVPYAQTRLQGSIDQVDAALVDIELRILQMNSSSESLTVRFLELTELRHVLRETAVFFQEVLLLT